MGIGPTEAVGVDNRPDEAASPERRHHLVLAVAPLDVVGVATDLTDLPGAVGDLLWVAVFGVSVLGYGRARSVWMPVLSITVFRMALAGVVYAEALLELASP